MAEVMGFATPGGFLAFARPALDFLKSVPLAQEGFQPPPGLGQWLACLFYLAAICAAVKHFVSLSSGKLLSRELFEEYRKTSEEWRKKLDDELQDLRDELAKVRTADAQARRILHHAVNSHDAALHYIAGQSDHGRRIKDILGRARPQEGEGIDP